MFSFLTAKKTVNLVFDDYVLRMVESSNDEQPDMKSQREMLIPAGIIEAGKIIDDMQFYEFMKEVVKQWGIKNRHVRFYVPNSLVIMRPVEFPASVKEEDVKEYFMIEMGETIHLPFSEPIFDIHSAAFAKDAQSINNYSEQKKRHGMLFAVPEAEVVKYTDTFLDVSLKPISADIKELGIYRYFYQMDQADQEGSYLFFELNLTSINLSIFYKHQLEFLRYQQLDLALKDWHADQEDQEKLTWIYDGDRNQKQNSVVDQINELDRIMDFYRYSLHQGNRAVTNIIILGDYPSIQDVFAQVNEQYDVKTTLLSDHLTNNVDMSYVPALGLALKGDS